jgi:hypothetical protein
MQRTRERKITASTRRVRETQGNSRDIPNAVRHVHDEAKIPHKNTKKIFNH